MGQPRPLFRLFLVFSNKQYNLKNVHQVYGTGIRTHDLLNMSRHPKPLDQGSRPSFWLFAAVFHPKGGVRFTSGAMITFLKDEFQLPTDKHFRKALLGP